MAENAPHFFKFLHHQNLQQGKLKIPERFTSKHGKDISDPVLLKVPNGTTWQVKLTKHNPGVWSLDGLQQFMEYHSLQLGYFLLFRYQGRSNFCVIMCDSSASEIEYPTAQSYSEDHKRKSSSYYDTEEGGGQISGTPVGSTRKSRALQMATCFKSKNPFFLVVMQPSYVCDRFRLIIPLSFTAKYFLKDQDDINLWVSNGGPWRVKYIRYSSRAKNCSRVIFGFGWKAFAQDNKLVVGDVCVFELNTGRESSLQVAIYRSTEDANSHDFKRMKVPKIEDSCDDHDVSVQAPGETTLNSEKLERKLDLSSRQDLEGKKRQISGIPRRSRALSSNEMATSLLKPESPFFMVRMQPSYVLHGLIPRIPKAFVHKHFPNKDHGDIIIRDSNGRTWPVKYGSSASQHYSPYVKFTCGWKEFMKDQDLEVGDACIFKLLNDIKLSLKVTFLRVNEYADGNHFERREKNEMPKKNLISSSMHGTTDESRHVTCQESIGKDRSNYPSFQGEGSTASGQRLPKHEICGSVKQMAASKKSRALQMAITSFKSENPFFVVFMQPSYVCHRFRLNIPLSFTTTYLPEDYGYVNLVLSNGGIWRVNYVRWNSNPNVKFTVGWEAFAQDNKLEVGDVCVFELIQGSSEKSLQVVIFRSRELTYSHLDSTRMESTCDVPVEKPKRKRGLSLQQKEGGKKRRTHLITTLVKPESPFFEITIQTSYVISGLRPHIPRAFFLEHFPNKDNGNVILRDPNGTTWPVKYISRPSKQRMPRTEFTSGWKEFMQAHDLEVGDTCVFELIDSIQFSLQVTILRLNQSEEVYCTKRDSTIKREEKENKEEDPETVMLSMISGEKRKVINTKESEDDVPTKDNSRRLETIAENRSDYPFFQITMHRSFLTSGVNVPKSFVRKHMERSCCARLQVGDKSWDVESRLYKGGSCVLGQFSPFARENSLREGDVCVFKLIESNDMLLLFKVSIVRDIVIKGYKPQ